MILSERAAIVTALADGGFHIYPAGKLNELIKKYTEGDTLQGNFERHKTIEKVRLALSKYLKGGKHAALESDFDLLCKRLNDFDPNYDFENEVEAITKKLPTLAKRYFGIDGYQSVYSKIVEYYFEGFNEMYKDADWYAFNVNDVEAREMKVSVGTYYKRSWIMPFNTAWAIVHENIHQMHRSVSQPAGSDRYVPWICEGIADVFGVLMLYKVGGNKNKIAMMKRFVEEVEVLNPRKAAYYYGFRIVMELLRNSGLGFMRALFEMTKEDVYGINWDVLAHGVQNGVLAHKLIPYIYLGEDKAAFERKFLKLEEEYSKKFKLDEGDQEVLSLFATMQPPSVITEAEYASAMWLKKQSIEKMEENWIVTEQDKLIRVKDVAAKEREKIEGFNEKVVIMEADVPKELVDGTKELCKKYFVVQREVEDKMVLSVWRGGLPFRLGCGEVRCELQL